MSDQIRVLIVDDILETRDHLTKLLGFEKDVEVVGAAASGAEALEMAARMLPDVVLMDINMPEMDGIAATELLMARVPSASVVMMSVQGEADYLRRSMLAGAREFLVKPFSSDELTASIRQVYARERDKIGRMALPVAEAAARSTAREPGRVVAVFSPKGGVGRTTIAVNIAVAAASEPGAEVVLVDGSFQFGDVGVLLNLNPKNKSIADLVPELEAGGEPDSLDTFVITHSTGTKVLLAPPSPEMAELVTPAAIRRVLDVLRSRSDLVIVDCAAAFSDSTLAVLDTADVILTVLTLEITSIKNMRLFLEVADQLGYPRGQDRAGPQPRRLGARHPRRGRRALDRPEGGPHGRQRRPKRRVRPQPGRAVLHQQPRGAGVAGRPPPRPGAPRSAGGRARRGAEAGAQEVALRVAVADR